MPEPKTASPSKPSSRLIFVYNADASPMGLLRDLYTGLKTGQTECNLCDLTFGRLLKDRSWQRFVDDLPHEVDFQLRSTFRRRHPHVDAAFPAVFVDGGSAGNGGLEVLIDKAQIDAVDDLDGLKALVARAVADRTTT